MSRRLLVSAWSNAFSCVQTPGSATSGSAGTDRREPPPYLRLICVGPRLVARIDILACGRHCGRGAATERTPPRDALRLRLRRSGGVEPSTSPPSLPSSLPASGHQAWEEGLISRCVLEWGGTRGSKGWLLVRAPLCRVPKRLGRASWLACTGLAGPDECGRRRSWRPVAVKSHSNGMCPVEPERGAGACSDVANERAS